MNAVGYTHALPIDAADALIDVEIPDPMPAAHDLLVAVKAVSVNPVDTKVRNTTDAPAGDVKILGWDAAGIVLATGAEVTFFRPGDKVWYAGSLLRPGSNSEMHLVDERIASKMPTTLDYAHAAALPLTALTAWELLFDRLRISRDMAAKPAHLLVVGAAGGVGSILIQLARALTNTVVIATASRPESEAWVRTLGAHHVIDHGQPLAEELRRIGVPTVEYIASLTHTEQHFAQLAEAVAPQGKLAVIDDPAGPLELNALKRKSASFHWEFMFTRSMFQTPDMIEQHHILNHIAELVDAGRVQSTITENYGTICAANLRRAHTLIESGTSRGKIVLEGF